MAVFVQVMYVDNQLIVKTLNVKTAINQYQKHQCLVTIILCPLGIRLPFSISFKHYIEEAAEVFLYMYMLTITIYVTSK